MQILTYYYPGAVAVVMKRAHVGVVGSGDLEVLMEPSESGQGKVVVTTSIDGYEVIWRNVIDRFFDRFAHAVSIEINDFGSTPGLVALRLGQAAEKVAS